MLFTSLSLNRIVIFLLLQMLFGHFQFCNMHQPSLWNTEKIKYVKEYLNNSQLFNTEEVF